MSDAAALRRRGFILVFVATFMWSLAGLFARLLPHLDIGTVLCGRAAFGGGCGLVVAFHDWRSARLEARAMLSPLAPLVILLSSTAISAYVAAVMTTSIADVLVIYATLPFWAAGLAFFVTGERSSRRTLIAASVALVGIAVMVIGGLGHGHLLGQAYSVFMTVAFALLVVLQRRDPHLPVAPINAVAALVAAAFGYAIAKRVEVTWFDLGVLAVFGITTITIAFALFMEGAKHVPPAEASLIAMLDVVMGPLWVLIAFGEKPDFATLIGGGIVLAAAVWRLVPELKRQTESIAPPVPTL
jgi:drug/metabolite transporter (DMT)-like permease